MPDPNKLLADTSSFHWFILLALLVSAFAVRLHNISALPHDFAGVRQYQAAHIARAYYLEHQEEVPKWKKKVVTLNAERMGLLLEPRILENLAVLGYRILGKEALWIPRAISSLFWVTGGLVLFLVARKMTSPAASLYSTAFFLFLPFSILSSRSFQPDPLMIMLMVMSVFMVVRYYEKPGMLELLSAAGVTSLALLAKPYSVFFIFCVYISIGMYKRGVRRTLLSTHMMLFSVVSFIPTTAYYVHGILTNVGFLNELAKGSFLPHLIFRGYYWSDWLLMIGLVVGYIPFIAGIAGLVTAERGLYKSVLSGLWTGYLIFGLMFTMHIHTHQYYSMPLIPVVALSIGTVTVSIVNLIGKRWKAAAITAGALAVVLIFALSQESTKQYLAENKESLKVVARFIGLNPQIKSAKSGDFQDELQMAKQIAEITGHSTNTVLLTPYFGRAIAFNGELSGLPWPTQGSLKERRERGLKPLSNEELFNSKYLTIRTHGEYITYTPDYFIITDFKEYEVQKDLRAFLVANYPLLAETKKYLIFDMRSMSGLHGK